MLLLRAALRTFLPVSEREGLALQQNFQDDPPELQKAQSNYLEVFKSGKEADDRQKLIGYLSGLAACNQFEAQGYDVYANRVGQWLNTMEVCQISGSPVPKYTPVSVRPAMKKSEGQKKMRRNEV
jgi:hypothetical protein